MPLVETGMKSSKGIAVLVTVGSTHFDPLVNSLTTEHALASLHAAGVSLITIQFGRGQPNLPQPLTNESSARSPTVDSFAYSASLAPKLASADIVVTHCGAGSVFEALSMSRHVVAVPNRSLMDDHQTELAEALAGSLRVGQVGQDVVDQVILTCADIHNGIEAKGDSDVPRNSSAIAKIVAEEVRQLRQ